MAGTGLSRDDQGDTAGRLLLERLGCRYVLITRGPDGMTLFERREPDGGPARVHVIRSVPRPVYDVTGAGDTVIAVGALAFASGASMREAAELANLAAGRVVLKFGTGEISDKELLDLVQRER